MRCVLISSLANLPFRSFACLNLGGTMRPIVSFLFCEVLRRPVYRIAALRRPDVKSKDAILSHSQAYLGLFETGSSKMSLPSDCPS